MKNDNDFDFLEGLTLSNKEQEMVDRANMISNIIFEIVKQRNEKKLSQRDIEKITGIRQPMIARIETLKAIPRLDTLISLCQAVGMKLDILPMEDEIIPLNININIKIDAEPIEPNINYKKDNSTVYPFGQVC